MSSPSGNSVAGRVKSDFQEMSRGLLVVASKAAWQFEHLCKFIAGPAFRRGITYRPSIRVGDLN
jgi:hypothetical protein